MRAFSVVLLTLVWSFPALTPIMAQQEFPAAATIRGENIWLRVDPAEDTDILGYLVRGDRVRVTGEATPADGDAFYPVEVVATGETGWVRDLAIDPRSWRADPEGVAGDVPEPARETASAAEDAPQRNRNRQNRPEPEVVEEPIVVEPAREAESAAEDEPQRNRNRRNRQEPQEPEVVEEPVVVEPTAEIPATTAPPTETPVVEVPPAATPSPDVAPAATPPVATPPAA
jgi:hypothetical protein